MRRALPWLVLLAVVGFLAYKLHSSHFDWAGFGRSMRAADGRLLVLAVLLIYSNNVVRALRWAVFLKPAYRKAGVVPTPWYRLVGPQMIGFAGLAIFGRLAELIRPVLIARRTGLPVASQIGVVAVERVFDLGAFGLLFAGNLLFMPGLRALPYLGKAGYTIVGLAVAITGFVAAVRLAGGVVARGTGRLVGLVSKQAGAAAEEKILSFRAGLDVVGTLGDFVALAGLSLVLWSTVALAYLLCLKSFPAPVQGLGLGATLVLMGFSIAGSALPIPGGGGAWAGNTFALAKLFGIAGDLAASAGLMVWLVTTIAVIPAGLVFARVEGVSLGQVARRSEAVEETL